MTRSDTREVLWLMALAAAVPTSAWAPYPELVLLADLVLVINAGRFIAMGVLWLWRYIRRANRVARLVRAYKEREALSR